MQIHYKYLRIAIACAEKSVKQGQTPFGAVIVRNDEIMASSHNSVWKDLDPTAHAEVNAIRQACHKLQTIDLSGCTLYSSCEPCPMCFSAIHWAKLDAVYFSARISHAQKAGFNELCISNEQMKKMGNSPLKIYGDLLAEEATKPFESFLDNPQHKIY